MQGGTAARLMVIGTFLELGCGKTESPPGKVGGTGGCPTADACDGSGGTDGGLGGSGPTMVCANESETAVVGAPGSCGSLSCGPGCTCDISGALIQITCPHFKSGCVETTCGTIICGETTTCVDPFQGRCEVK